MSSGAIWSSLAEDSELATLGVESVHTDYSEEIRPSEGYFIILRWMGHRRIESGVKKGPQTLVVWAHQPIEMGNDFTVLNKILRRCREILEDNVPNSDPGLDFISVSHVDYEGDSGNMVDPGFKTLTKNSSFRVLMAMV